MKATRDLSELLDQARKAAPEFLVSDIKSLVESGKTSPLAAKRSFRPRRITQMFNPLKFLIMITPIVIITSMLLIWNPVDGKKTEDGRQKTVRPEDGKAERREPANSRSDQPASVTIETAPESLGVPVMSVRRPAGNELTDTLFKGDFLELSKDELIRLGFLFDEEGYYYLNRLPNGDFISLWSWKSGIHSSSGFEESKSVHRLNKQKAGDLDFYPLLSTSLSGEDLHTINLSKTFTADSFEIMNDTLVPVLFKASTFGGNFTSDLLLWFKPSGRFFELIGNEKAKSVRERIQMVKELTLSSSSQKDRVTYDFNNEPVSRLTSVDSLKTVKLSAEVFRCMGIAVSPESIDVIFKDKGMPYRWRVNKYGVGVSRLSPQPEDQDYQTISDTLQVETPSIYAIGTGLYNRVTSSPVGFSIESTDLLIPVQIADSYLAPFIRELVFWIYPNERFFNCLPPEIARPMRMEFNYQKKRMDPDFVPRMGGSVGIGGGAHTRGSFNMGIPVRIPDRGLKKDSVNENIEPVPCVYFTNLCESLPGLDYVNLYPNPVTDQLNVDLVLQKAKKIRFRVFDLGGRVISEEGAPENYAEVGQSKHQMDVSKLQGGFYLLVMTDDEGAKLTRRFVKN